MSELISKLRSMVSSLDQISNASGLVFEAADEIEALANQRDTLLKLLTDLVDRAIDGRVEIRSDRHGSGYEWHKEWLHVATTAVVAAKIGAARRNADALKAGEQK